LAWFFNEIEKIPEPSWGHLEAIVSQLGTILGHLAAVSEQKYQFSIGFFKEFCDGPRWPQDGPK
jgi:hypothetical protein